MGCITLNKAERSDHQIRCSALGVQRRSLTLISMLVFFPILFLLFLVITPSVPAAVRQADLAKQYRITRIYQCNLSAGIIESSRSNWQWGVNSFQKIYKAAGRNELALYARFRSATMYRDMGRRFSSSADLNEAVRGYETVARLAPSHTLADDALFNLAIIYLEDKKDFSRAAKGFDYIVRTYPTGDMARLAEEKLESIRANGKHRKGLAGSGGGKYLYSINHWSTGEYSRVVIKVSGQVQYKEKLISGGTGQSDRLLIDFLGSGVDRSQVAERITGQGLLRNIRTSQISGGVRVILEAVSMDKFRLFSMNEPFRLIVDMKGKKGEVGPVPGIVKTVIKKQMKDVSSGTPSLAQQLGLGVRKVVIDAGHGGKDPGAVGVGGLQEKDITLAVAKKLARRLQNEFDLEVKLTRSRDVYLPLEERTAIAKIEKGDLFISIHVNAARSPEKKGVETYVLGLAGNEEAMRLAARENATSLAGMSDIQEILASLLDYSKKEESMLLATAVQKKMVKGLQAQDRGVRSAPFYVLTNAEMPAILAEISFITNPAEARKLRNEGYLDTVAGLLAAGLAEYVKQQAALR